MSKPRKTKAHPDARLLALGEHMLKAHKLTRRFAALAKSLDADHYPEEQADVAFDRYFELLEAVNDCPARTVDGLRVKAQALATIYSGDVGEFAEDSKSTDMRLARQVIYGLLAV